MDAVKNYWDNRYKSNETGWDNGEITPALKDYFDQLENKTLKILISGAGNSHEAEYLHNKGFTNVYVVDISPTALDNFKKRVPSFPIKHIHCQNFFELKGEFDIQIEQTFFCAIDPKLRPEYVKKSHELLTKNGKIVGLMFCFPLTENGPPFGGSIAEYSSLFKHYFTIEIMEKATNYIDSRNNRELFVKLIKK